MSDVALVGVCKKGVSMKRRPPASSRCPSSRCATLASFLITAAVMAAVAGSAATQRQFEELGKRGLPANLDATYSTLLGDVDGDGDLDLIVGNFGQSRLYLNNGTGTFTDATASRMPVDATGSLALGDVDRDGDLDLVLGNGQCRLYLNLLRQLDAPYVLHLGRNYQLDVYSRYGPATTTEIGLS
jgi:hypothetical protein